MRRGDARDRLEDVREFVYKPKQREGARADPERLRRLEAFSVREQELAADFASRFPVDERYEQGRTAAEALLAEFEATLRECSASTNVAARLESLRILDLIVSDALSGKEQRVEAVSSVSAAAHSLLVAQLAALGCDVKTRIEEARLRDEQLSLRRAQEAEQRRAADEQRRAVDARLGGQEASSKERGTGYVYALTNAAMPGLVKIGYTDRHPEKRTKELSSPTVHQLAPDMVRADRLDLLGITHGPLLSGVGVRRVLAPRQHPLDVPDQLEKVGSAQLPGVGLLVGVHDLSRGADDARRRAVRRAGRSRGRRSGRGRGQHPALDNVLCRGTRSTRFASH